MSRVGLRDADHAHAGWLCPAASGEHGDVLARGLEPGDVGGHDLLHSAEDLRRRVVDEQDAAHAAGHAGAAILVCARRPCPPATWSPFAPRRTRNVMRAPKTCMSRTSIRSS